MSGRGPSKAAQALAPPKASGKQVLALNPVVANVRRQTVKLHELEEEFAAMEDEEKIRGVSEIVAEEKAKKQMRQHLDAASKKERRLSRHKAQEARGHGPLMDWAEEEGTTWDLTKSQTLTLKSLVDTLQQRYARDKVYTYCGTILVALNPYKSIADKAYTMSIMAQYRDKPIGEHPPHVFAIADSAYREMMGGRDSVSVVISGESGAGKTETTKLILNYISSLNSEPTAVEAKLIESATLLEAFGNAKTVRNNNSSRFGKLIKILFDGRTGLIAGAEIETYLLERSRVSHQDANERNFHIFYQLTEGATDEDREQYQLSGAADYRFTETCVSLGLNEAEELQQLKDGLVLFGFSNSERDAIFTVVAAILHLGNVTFGYNAARLIATVENNDELEIASHLLQVPAKELGKVLVERTLNVRGQVIRKGLTAEEAAGTRDALCRTMYGAMFDWIVAKLNAGLKSSGGESSKFLGVLDIFGFENFATNSFEQLCINYANEKLHALFVEHVFTLEQEEYTREGLKWTPLSTADNVECINLIEGKMGVLMLLDEESKLQAGTDESFLKKLATTHAKNKYYKPSRLNASKAFVVSHFAEEVTYTVDGFRDKNQNTLADDVRAVVTKSELAFVAALLSDGGAPLEAADAPASPRGKPDAGSKSPLVGAKSPITGPKSPSVQPLGGSGTVGSLPSRGANTTGFTFRKQLMALKTTLSSTKPYFVRCIKPNPQQKPNAFESTLVNSQLAYSGMLETVRIRQQGYAFRIEYADVLERYRPMGIVEATKADAGRFMAELARTKVVTAPQYALGNSKLFLKSDGQLGMEKALVRALRKWAVIIQAWVRMWIRRRHFVRVRECTSIIQRNARIVQENARLKRLVVASLQCAVFCERQREEAREQAALMIQRNVRAVTYNTHLKRCVVAALACARICERTREKQRERARLEAERKRREAEERKKAEAAEKDKEKAAAASKARAADDKSKRGARVLGPLTRSDAESKESAEAAERRRKEEEEAAEIAALEEEDRRLEAEQRAAAAAAAAAAASGPPGRPATSPRRAAPLPPGGASTSTLRDSSASTSARMSSAVRASASMQGSNSWIDDDTAAQVAEILAMQAPDDPTELLNFAKAMQRKVKGQCPEVADAMYTKAVECYRRGLERFEDCDAFVNCGTALINHANLRFVMAHQYPSKSQACIPLLSMAEKMLEKAMTLGLDAEGKEAISLRVLKCQELKDQALAEDMRKLTPQHRAKLAADIKAKIDAIKPQERQGKVQRDEKGLMGRVVWKDFLLVLSAATLQLYVKSTNEKPKLEILLAEVTAAKETTATGGKLAFAVVTATQYHAFACKDRGEVDAWVAAITTNLQRVKLQTQARAMEQTK